MDKNPKTAPACLTFALEQQPSEGNARRFRGVAYSGGVVPQYGWFGDTCIDLASLVLPAGKLFALVDHDPSQRAGQFSARIEGNALIVEGDLFQSSAAGREVAALLSEGAPWQMSVGVQAETEQSDHKRAVQVNGRVLEVNTVFRNAVLREVSFVPVGADPNTAVAAFSRNMAGAVHPETIPQNQEGDSSMTIEELQAQVSELTQQLAASKAEAESAHASLAQIRMTARKAAIKELSAQTGREFKAEESAALEKLEEEAFVVLSAVFVDGKKKTTEKDKHLFSDQATAGKDDAHGSDENKPTLAKLNATLIHQLSGKE